MADINTVELTGRVARDLDLRLMPPDSTLYVTFEIPSRGEWPDVTGEAILLEYRHRCFAQDPTAESILWVRVGDAVHLRGRIDLVFDGLAGPEHVPAYKPGIRIHELNKMEENDAS